MKKTRVGKGEKERKWWEERVGSSERRKGGNGDEITETSL